MPKIAVAECHQEVSSFNPVPSRYEDFIVLDGEELFEHHSDVREEVGGAMRVLGSASGFELIPAYGARSITSGGILARADFERLSGEFLDALRAAGPVDAAYLALHGAMAAEAQDDPEGYLLEQTRQILGEEIPIVVSLDLHGVLTDKMLRHADAIVVYQTYPHVDFYETGERASQLLLKILIQGVRPVMAKVEIPALVRGDELITETGSLGSVIRIAQRFERQPGGLAAGMFIGNPFTDLPDLRSYSLVVTDGDAETATQQAVELAELFWEHHEKMQVPLTPIDEAVKLAGQTEGTAILMDAADATSSGASGDSTAVVARARELGYSGAMLAPVVDAAAATKAFDAGVGSTVDISVGGKLDPARFQPLAIRAEVRLLSDGRFRSESFGWHWDSGRTAVLQADNLTLVVTTRPVSLFDRALFFSNGQDPRRFDMVVVKSPHCEPHMFADWAGRVVNVDTPGATSANLRSLGHTKCRRPVFPLDENVEFVPRAKVFRRGQG